MKLSKRALLLLRAMLAENSGIQLPVGVVREVIEIKEWVEKELYNEESKEEQNKKNK